MKTTSLDSQLRKIENPQALIGEARIRFIDDLGTEQFYILQPEANQPYPVINKNGECVGRHSEIGGAIKIGVYAWQDQQRVEKLKKDRIDTLNDLVPDKNKDFKIHR